MSETRRPTPKTADAEPVERVAARRGLARLVPTPLVAGLGLLGLGGFMVFGGGSAEARREVRNAAGIPFFVPERHPIKPWIAAVSVAGGLLLVFRELGPHRGRRRDP